LWREEAKVGEKMEPIERGGTFPDGKTYANFDQFKALLLGQKEKLARSLVEGTMSYGLGRTAEFSDGDDLDVLTSQLIKDGLRAKSLIHNLVQSSIFQTK
jgi:hypothetical protein